MEIYPPETPSAAPAAAAETAPAGQPKPRLETPAEVAQMPETASLAATSGAAAGDGRILIKAKTNSWIQVRDNAAGELLLTRLLRAGDSYAVPNRPGLQLSTGNAGAIEILVDGQPVPSIGAEGTVRRKVALDAERLKAGTAVNE